MLNFAGGEECEAMLINSVVENDDDINIKVYPNPASSIVQFEGDGVISVRVVNLIGKLQFQQNDIQEKYFDVSNLVPGVYFLNFLLENSRFKSIKIIVE